MPHVQVKARIRNTRTTIHHVARGIRHLSVKQVAHGVKRHAKNFMHINRRVMR